MLMARRHGAKKALFSLVAFLALSGFVQSQGSLDFGGDDVENVDQVQRLLLDVLKALENAIHFFSEDYSSINVDGLFGIRLAQGSIIKAAWFCHKHNARCPPDLKNQLVYLNQTIGDLGEKALPYVKADGPDYFRRFSPTVDAPYIVEYAPVSISDYIQAPGQLDEYHEEDGDMCLSNVMGTGKDGDRPLPKCYMNDHCFEVMTRPAQSRYSITHQLLFFIVAEKNGCTEHLNRVMSQKKLSSVKEQEKLFCGHIVSEMRQLTRYGDVNSLNQDLFLEQSVLCGALGFKEIFEPSWISMVLNWQNSRGCFSMPSELVNIESQLQQVSQERRKLLDLLAIEANAIERSTKSGRKLLREKIMDDECLSHKSGLGFGTIGVYLRYLVQTLFS